MCTVPRSAVFPSASVLAALAITLVGGCGSDDSKKVTAVGTPVGLAILTSDYAVTNVSLYAPSAGELTDGCVTSATTLKQSLSGDATLPSQPTAGHELVVIDRKNAVLTFVNPTDCAARGQISVSTGGFKGNPRDFISLGAHKAYVSRYEINDAASAEAGDFDDGNDILVVDPQLVGPTDIPVLKRIALGDYATTVEGATILARPDRGVLANGKVYVTLGNLSSDFVAGPGRVVVIDPATDEVTGTIELAAQKGCSAIDYVDATKRLYVSCWGAPGDADPAAASALVEIDISGAGPVVGRTIRAKTIGDLPLNFVHATVLGDVAFVGTLGAEDFVTHTLLAPDAFYAVDLATQTPNKILEATGAFNFGRSAVDPSSKKVYLPDGDALSPRVHIFDAASAKVAAAGTFEANPGAHLPPREVAWY